MSTTITIAFYMGMGESEPWINKMTSFLTGKCMHCEMVFTSPSGTHEACGVWQGETVFLRSKRWIKSCWRFLSLPVTRTQRAAMYKFCREQAEKKKPFNKWGFWRSISPWPRRTQGDSWFCSELCLTCLHRANLLVDEVAAACTPSSLYASMVRAGAFASSAPDGVVAGRVKMCKRPLTHRWTHKLMLNA